MALIGVLNSFSDGNVIYAAGHNSNYTDIKTAFNTSAVLTDVAKTITVGHTWSAAQAFPSITGPTTITGALTVTGLVSTGGSFAVDVAGGIGQVALRLVRVGGTATDWTIYGPQASTDLRFFSGIDRATLTSGGVFSATGGFSGALTGNVTGNVTGNLTGNVAGNLTGTVLTAAQGNITSLGTLTSLAVNAQIVLQGINQGTLGQYLQFQNTGGVTYFGLENSIGTTFACTPYATVISADAGRNIEFSPNRTRSLILTTGGIVLVGTTVTAGAAAGELVLAYQKWYRGIHGNLTTTHPIARVTGFGYAPATYPLVQLGDGTRPIGLNYDPSGNASGAFTGDGTEVYFPNVTNIRTPNAANTSYLARMGFPTAGGVAIHTDLSVPAASRFYLDGGVDTYIYESTANKITIVAGAVTLAHFRSDSFIELGTGVGVGIQPTARLYLDGGSNSYLVEEAADQIRVVVGATNSMRFYTTGVDIPSGQKFWLDGGSDSYIWESAANIIQVVAGAVAGIILSSTNLNLSNLTSITGATAYNGNVTGNLTGTVLTAAQGNITSLGTLSAVTVSGLATVGSLNVGTGTTLTKLLSVVFTFNWPSIAAHSFAETTVTVTGAAVGDAAFVTQKNASGTTNGQIYQARVSAADTVEVSAFNPGTGASDVGSDDYRVVVMKF